MIRHILTIGSTDVQASYGVALNPGAVAAVVGIPSFKALKSNDWHEYSGLDVDLSDPHFEEGVVEIPMSGRQAREAAQLLTVRPYVHVDVSNTPFSANCRLLGVRSYATENGLETCRLRLGTDTDYATMLYNARNSHYNTPVTMEPFGFADWETDNWGLWGVRLLDGWRSAFDAPRDIKTPLVRDISVIDGVEYDSDTTPATYREKSVTFQLLLHGPRDISVFWGLYHSFMYRVAHGWMMLMDEQGEETEWYYGGMSVVEYMPTDAPWLKFNVRLNMIG
jgi:hypothetical protein